MNRKIHFTSVWLSKWTPLADNFKIFEYKLIRSYPPILSVEILFYKNENSVSSHSYDHLIHKIVASPKFESKACSVKHMGGKANLNKLNYGTSPYTYSLPPNWTMKRMAGKQNQLHNTSREITLEMNNKASGGIGNQFISTMCYTFHVQTSDQY